MWWLSFDGTVIETSGIPDVKPTNHLIIMGLHRETVLVLEDEKLCKRVTDAVSRNYSKKYIMEMYGLTRNQLDHILNVKNTKTPYYGDTGIDSNQQA